MILSPDDLRSLQGIGGGLGADEPYLAAMFRIFARLSEQDGPPPSEDRITARPPPGAAEPAARLPRRRRRRALRARLAVSRSRSGVFGLAAAVVLPATLLVTLMLVMIFGLFSTPRCPAPAGPHGQHTPAAVRGAAGTTPCPAPGQGDGSQTG